ncbi:MAG TPA: S1 RNA-binding domain-containing protein, partial [Anaerolineae bacterium]|nr:S1 RNA-binding domain-containing protein [Anaerolineae bacterium]
LLREGEYARAISPLDEGEVLRRLGAELLRPEDQVLSLQEKSDPEAPEDSESLYVSEEDPLERDWRWIQESLANGEAIDGKVTGYNRGGLLVELNNLQGFVPISHLADFPRRVDAEERKAELASRIGEKLSLRVIEVDRGKDRLILSERQLAPTGRSADEVWDRICEGDVCQGRVTNLCSFGAFVDLGGVEGLIHISEMSWGRVAHPRDVLRSGEEVEVYVLGVDRERQRIALSLKRLQPDPWSLVEERYKVGQLIEGTITNVVSFGAFARIEEGLEGLIHISELAEGDFLHPRNVVKEGDRVTVRILDIDSTRHRLRLSLRRAWTANESAGNSDQLWDAF